MMVVIPLGQIIASVRSLWLLKELFNLCLSCLSLFPDYAGAADRSSLKMGEILIRNIIEEGEGETRKDISYYKTALGLYFRMPLK